MGCVYKRRLYIMETRVAMATGMETMTVELKTKTVEKLRVIGKKGESYYAGTVQDLI
jgi:hypothetical protein